MESYSLCNSFYIKEEGRGEADDSFAIEGVVSISGIDWFIHPSGGKGVFSNEPPVNAGDTSPTVNKGLGVDGLQGV